MLTAIENDLENLGQSKKLITHYELTKAYQADAESRTPTETPDTNITARNTRTAISY